MTPTIVADRRRKAQSREFPDLETIDARAKATRAVLLPDRWCAIGYAAGRREVFRVWGKRIPDELLLSPDWLNTAEPEALLGGERAWLVDFDAALAERDGASRSRRQQVERVRARRGDRRRFNLAPARSSGCSSSGSSGPRTPQQTRRGARGPARRAARFAGPRLRPARHADQQHRERRRPGYSPSDERAPPLTPSESAKLPKEKDALQLLTLRARHRARQPARRQHRQRAPPRAAHRAAHDERAVARHVRPLPDGAVESAGRREATGCSRRRRSTRCAATRVAYLRPDRPAAAAAHRQAALRHPAASSASASSIAAGRRRDRHRQGARRAAADVRDREPQGAAAEGRRRRPRQGHPADRRRGRRPRSIATRTRARRCARSRTPFSDAQTSEQGRRDQGAAERVGRHRVLARASLQLQRLPARSAVFGRLSRRRAVGARRREEPAERSARRATFTAARTTTSRRSPRCSIADARALRRRCSMRTRRDRRCCRRSSRTRCRRNRATRSIVRAARARAVARSHRSRRRRCSYIEAAPQNEAMFTVQTPEGAGERRRSRRSPGRATLGDHVAQTLAAQPLAMKRRPRDAVAAQARRCGRAPRAADARSGRRQAEPRLPGDAADRRAEHRVSHDARRVLVPARRVDHGAREPPARADARGQPERRLRRRLRVGREPEGRHAARQRRLPARAVARAGRERGDPAQRLHGQPRAGRVQHRRSTRSARGAPRTCCRD